MPLDTPVATAAPAVATEDAAPLAPVAEATPSTLAGPEPGGVAHDSYLDRILAMIEGHVEYPLQARRMRWEGQARLRCTIARDGAVRAVELETSSGYRLLDAAAMRAIQQAGPFPPLPEAIAGETVLLSIPIRFRLEN